jgi:hypothetical protein
MNKDKRQNERIRCRLSLDEVEPQPALPWSEVLGEPPFIHSTITIIEYYQGFQADFMSRAEEGSRLGDVSVAMVLERA